MKRANLLLTDQSSSGSKMTTTGLSTPSGSTRTKAAKGLFSHFMFLASLLLIALLTSGKALADNYTITLSGTNLTIQGGSSSLEQDQTNKTFTLLADEGYTLPAVGTITVTGTGELTKDNGDAGWSYDNGTITLGSSVDLTSGITVAADGVAKNIATLKTFTYQLDDNGAVAVDGFTQDEYADSYTVPIQDFTKSIKLAGTVTDLSGAQITLPDPVPVTINETTGKGSATATLTVTAKDGTSQIYTVNFSFHQAKITSVTAPDATKKLESRVETAAEVITDLPTEVTVVTENEDITTLEIEWAYKGGEFDPAAGAKNTFTWTAKVPGTLDVNSQTVSGEVAVTNAAASTDATLSALTYSVEGVEGSTEVTDFNAEDTESNQEYTVVLPIETPDGKVITVTATPNDAGAEIEEKELTATLDEGTAEITFDVTPESGSGEKRTIKITFNRAKSDVVTLSNLQYQIGDGAPIAVEGFNPDDTDGETYAVVLPYNTSETAVITILPVATDNNAKITPEEKKVTLSGGEGTITLTVTAANGETNQTIVINFTTAKEKITAIVAPTLELTKDDAKANEVAVKAKVDAIKNVIATSESGADNIELAVTWALKGSPFTDVPGAKNTYTWTITDQNYDLTTVGTTGEMVVVNYVAAFVDGGAQKELTIKDDELVNQIGNGQDEIVLKSATVNTNLDALAFSKATVGENVTISSANAVGELTFNETTVTGKVDLQGSVPSIVLNNATIGEIALADGKETTISLQATSNSIATITNAGTLTLNDAADVAPLSLAVDTRAATLDNKGAVKAVENNGAFTDNTASIVTVTGDADLKITVLPKGQSTTGNEVTLTVAASATHDVIYQWQTYTNQWENAENGTTASLTIKKEQNGSTQYRCEVKSTNSDKSTTLYTPDVTVTFRTESTPGEPSNPSTPTYTVSLDKVTGATFSKGETTTVNEGENFSFKITLDKDYDQSKPVVTADGTAITADADGNYTIKNVQKDIKIIVSGIVKNTATGIEETVADAPRAWSVGSTLYIHVPETADVYVISGTGALQQQLRGVSGDYNMQLRAGFYIVRIGNVSQKVIIR